MDVFVSWSGDLSHRVALILKDWLPYVIQQIQPYVSSEDLRKGNRWSLDVARQLEMSDQGVICLTRDNLDAPWVHFEAGAISKSVDASAVWTLLVGDLDSAEVVGPLAQFQHTQLEREDFFRLLMDMNERLGEQALPDQTLRHIYDKFWPDLDEKIANAFEAAASFVEVEPRSDREVLRELLDLSRTISQSIADVSPGGSGRDDVIYNYSNILHIAPTSDESKISAFQKTAMANTRIRAYGINSHGAGGLGVEEGVTEYNSLHLQSYHPIAEEALFSIAESVGLQPIDVDYRRVVYSRPKKDADAENGA